LKPYGIKTVFIKHTYYTCTGNPIFFLNIIVQKPQTNDNGTGTVTLGIWTVGKKPCSS
jgi:hypothetical protein